MAKSQIKIVKEFFQERGYENIAYIYKKGLTYFVYNSKFTLNIYVYACRRWGGKENEHNRT